jgi:acetyltransferase-like isoleucine patch superfamily enzyme
MLKTKGDIIIGKDCWVGANSIILSGVQLGDRTVVAAGSVVTKSFVHGSVLIGGVPAKIMKRI